MLSKALGPQGQAMMKIPVTVLSIRLLPHASPCSKGFICVTPNTLDKPEAVVLALCSEEALPRTTQTVGN